MLLEPGFWNCFVIGRRLEISCNNVYTLSRSTVQFLLSAYSYGNAVAHIAFSLEFHMLQFFI